MELIAVIGGGPAGMLAAATAASRAKAVVLIEKNHMLGKKLLITGKGRCNITNSADISDFIKQVPTNASFLYSAFYTFTNEQLLQLFKQLGLATKVERGGRVFPVSDRSADVLNALKKLLQKTGVKQYQGEVQSVKLLPDGKKRLQFTDKKALTADKVVIATGGMSYPATGSTGDGYRFAKMLGHRVTALKPSLVPIETQEAFVKELQGLSLKNVQLTVKKGNQTVFSDMGEMMFTHFGVSGPLVLSASSHMRGETPAGYTMSVDLKPALDDEMLDKRILRDFLKYQNRDLINALGDLLPIKLIGVVISLSGIPARKKVHEITRAERMRLAGCIKGLSLTPKAYRPITEAVITSGGVDVKEINPSTMESKLVPGLFFAGEVLDVDAYTGGFNLQIAFSTGYLAGKNL